MEAAIFTLHGFQIVFTSTEKAQHSIIEKIILKRGFLTLSNLSWKVCLSACSSAR